MLLAIFVYEMRQHVSLKVVYLYHGDTKACRQSLGKTYTYEKRTHKSRTSGEGYGRKFLAHDTGLFEGLVDNRHNILLVSAAGQLGHHTAIRFVHRLGCRYIGQKYSVPDNCCTGIIAGRFSS
jgi:hypothetical protein